MKKNLSETLELQLVVSDTNLPILIENMCSEWGGVPYPQLSVLLVHLRFLAMIHQTHHWIVKGDPFYSDHLLFQRLYDGVASEIDDIAEKVVGLGMTTNVDLTMQCAQVYKLVQGYGMSSTIPQQNELARRSLLAEMNFIATLNILVEMLRETSTMTYGLDNVLSGIADKHEENFYLLKQRVSHN